MKKTLSLKNCNIMHHSEGHKKRHAFTNTPPKQNYEKHSTLCCKQHFLSLLSDSNQRPRDYKSRALAN